uniref:Protein HGH1 homolog n=2 Tax=Pyrodinium bahamense TaxID=73915 RepID=A0A7S0BE59_9DINO|mmetsp:Transcript_9889/g.27670  ORF Transcript_9889/g.27670 Transcript_9889/m.27670 type:complete len:197 (+) Transcript_9889:576-1166(+)
MEEHTAEDKIAEEALQATRALMSRSAEYRRLLSEMGLARQLAHVLKENPHDRGAISLACLNMASLVGPADAGKGDGDAKFSAEIQARATEEGAVEQVLATVMSDQETHHKEHGMFNFNVDMAYNVHRDCFKALANLARDNTANQAAMLQAGLPDRIAAVLASRPADAQARWAGCEVLGSLAQSAALPAMTTVACQR